MAQNKHNALAYNNIIIHTPAERQASLKKWKTQRVSLFKKIKVLHQPHTGTPKRLSSLLADCDHTTVQGKKKFINQDQDESNDLMCYSLSNKNNTNTVILIVSTENMNWWSDENSTSSATATQC